MWILGILLFVAYASLMGLLLLSSKPESGLTVSSEKIVNALISVMMLCAIALVGTVVGVTLPEFLLLLKGW